MELRQVGARMLISLEAPPERLEATEMGGSKRSGEL